MKCVKRIQTKFEDFVHRLCLHLQSFWAPWLIIGCMLFAVLVLGSPLKLYVLLGLIALFVIMVLIKPMNIIHGLIGTRGDIRLFFLMFFLINVLFAGIYYYGFFCNAGITYDCNQPHIEFELFKTTNDKGKLVISSRDEESLPSTCSNQDHYYYRTTCQWVLQNTILTSLMQEPTDFFSASGIWLPRDTLQGQFL